MVGELQSEDPRSVGPYHLLGRLGAGGMGQVFLGRSVGGRLVAVKVIRPELAGEPGFRERFAREVAAARDVSGLFTALVIDADMKGPVPWLATAYVAGPSLAEAVDDEGPLPLASVLTLAAGLAEGLEAIHAAGMVHRDLKPSNVLLAQDGPRVIDFGISRAVEATRLTQSGTVIGSPGFMSPEQAEGGTVGPASDMFSLGAVLTFAATGKGPFGTGGTPALMYRVVHGQPDIARLPERIRPLVERCLAKNPDDRPTTGDLLAELGTGQLAADWLPASLAEALPGYSPPDPAPAVGLASSAAERVALDGSPPSAGTASEQATVTGAGIRPGTAQAYPDPPAGRLQRGHRRRAVAAAVIAGLVVLASTAVALALDSGTGPHHTAAASSSRPRIPASSSSSSASVGASSAVTSTGSFGTAPKVTIPKAKAGSKLEVKTLIQGSGTTVTRADALAANFVLYFWNGTSSSLKASTFTSNPTVIGGKMLPGLETALIGKKVGSRVLAVIPPAQGYGTSGNSQIGVTGSTTLVFVIDILKSYSDTQAATGTQVSTGGGTLPTVSAKAGSAPTLTFPSTSPPSTLVAKTLLKGSGPKVVKGDYVIAQYVGYIWRTKKVFGSSWSSGSPFGFVLGASPAQVIPGWDTGLAGQTVGSRVLLSIPPKEGYGSAGASQAGIKGTDTLVFVVDIIDALKPA